VEAGSGATQPGQAVGIFLSTQAHPVDRSGPRAGPFRTLVNKVIK